MNFFDFLKASTAIGLLVLVSPLTHADESDIYSIQFSEDGKYLITGGNGGYTLAKAEDHSGGIKIWNSETGALIESLGLRDDLDAVFGSTYGRVGDQRWGISNFKDVVLIGSYPDGKVLLLPSSLGYMANQNDVRMPDRVGAQVDFSGKALRPIDFKQFTGVKGDCGSGAALPDFIGPIVPSENGRYAGIVVNTCHADKNATDSKVNYQYSSDLHVMDLRTFAVIKSFDNIDAGLFALGVSDNGERVAFVGRDEFAVLDIKTGKKRLVESYTDGQYFIPRQFSTLQFSENGEKLISLQNIYDIETGTETPLKWVSSDTKKPRRVSSIEIAPDLSFFSIVVPKRSLVMFGEDGLPKSYGKADKVMLLNARTGEQIDLEITDSMTEGKRCVTDISSDSRRVAVGCKGGVLRVYDAQTGKIIWKNQNAGAKDLSKQYIQAQTNTVELAMLLAGH